MALTKPTAAQINSAIEVVTDPLSLFNNKSTQANVDVGFILNRDGGTNSNIALVWQETNKQFAIGLTTANGATNANVSFISYANVKLGNLITDGNVSAAYFTGSGQFLTGLPASYSNVNVKAYTESMGFQNYGNANVTAYTVSMGFQNYGNVNVIAYTQTQSYTNYSNVNVAAYTQTQSYTNYSNVNLSAYLGGAVTIGGNLTVNGNLFINGNATTINANNLSINDSMIYLADDNPADLLDIGFVSSFTNPGYQHTGFVRDASDGVWKLFANVTAEPTTTVDFTNANYSSLYVGNIQTTASANIGSTLNVVGNVLGSIGTFSALTVSGFINTSGNVSAAVHTGGAISVTGFINTTANVSAAQINGATAVITGSAYAGELFATTRAGDEGGQLNLANAVTNTTLIGNIVIDVFQNKLRIFEGAGTNRGGYFDLSGLTANVGTNLAAGGGGGTPGGGQGQIQFNSSSAFAGAASLYYFGANGAIVANAGIASTSTATGTMQITGGIGVSGTVFAGQLNTSGNVLATAGLFNALTVNGLINASGNILSTGASIFGNVTLGSLTTPGALNTLAGNVTIYGASSMLNIIGNIVVNNTAIASSNVTGAIRTTGGVGVGGNLYVGQRVGYVWGANNVSSVYQVFNNSTNSLDTVFG